VPTLLSFGFLACDQELEPTQESLTPEEEFSRDTGNDGDGTSDGNGNGTNNSGPNEGRAETAAVSTSIDPAPAESSASAECLPMLVDPDLVEVFVRIKAYQIAIDSWKHVDFVLQHRDEFISLAQNLRNGDTDEVGNVLLRIGGDIGGEVLANNQDQIFEVVVSQFPEDEAQQIRDLKLLHDEGVELSEDLQQFIRLVTRPHEVFFEFVVEAIKEQVGWNDFVDSLHKLSRHTHALETAIIAMDEAAIADAAEKVALEFEHMNRAAKRLKVAVQAWWGLPGGTQRTLTRVLNDVSAGLGDELLELIEVARVQIEADAEQLIHLSQVCGESWCGDPLHPPWHASADVVERWPEARCVLDRTDYDRCFKAPAYVKSRKKERAQAFGCPATYSRCCLPP
jgi:hypothetical protein